MSMHIIEDFVENAVRAVAGSWRLERRRKLNLIHTLYLLQENGDCGFTNMRCMRDLVACGYTFLCEEEEMPDFAERPGYYRSYPGEGIAYAQGSLYRYKDWEDRFPEADGKLCVDSGSPSWALLVAAGRLKGADALPVRKLPTAEALADAKAAVEEAFGWDAARREGLLALFLLSDAAEPFSGALADEQMRDLLGITRAQYEAGDYEEQPAVAQAESAEGSERLCELRGESLRFVHYAEVWADHSYVYYGYHTPEPAEVQLWGGRVPLRVLVLPDRPQRVNPFAVDEHLVPWLAGAAARAGAAFDFFSRHTERCRPYLEGGFDPADRAFVNADALSAAARRYQEAGERGGSFPELSATAAGIFGELADSCAGLGPGARRLDPEHPFVQLLLFFYVQARMLLFAARQAQPAAALEPALRRFLTEASKALTPYEPGARGGELMNPEQYRAMLAELESGAEPPDYGRQVTLLDQLWQSPAVPLGERLYLAWELHTLLHGLLAHLEEQVAAFREELGGIPPLDGELAEVAAHLEGLDRAGPDFVLRAAREAHAKKTGGAGVDGWRVASLRVALDRGGAEPEVAVYLYCVHPDAEPPVLVQLRRGEVTDVSVG